MMQRRKNVLMDVTPTPPPPEERVPTPPPPLPKPTEKDIFKQPKAPVLPTVVEEEEEQDEQIPQVAPPKKQKRPCTDKMKAHLARCRELAKEKKAKIKAAKAPPPQPMHTPSVPQAQPMQVPQRPTTNWIPDDAPPQQRPTTNMAIDYDRIINGLAGRMNSAQVEEDALTMLEKRIREEERAHAEKKYSEYFVDAASKFKKKMYTGYGRQTILGRNTNKPFGAYAYDKTASNPFDKCFN